MWKQDKQDSASEDVGQGNGSASLTDQQESSDNVSAFVGKGVEFKGTITYRGTVKIDGSLDGEIHTEGVLLVGEEAVITAKVTAGTIVCKGKITGEMVAKEKIKLRAPAVISGGVKTPKLSVEDGVLLNGTLEMTQGIKTTARETVLHPISASEQTQLRRANG